MIRTINSPELTAFIESLNDAQLIASLTAIRDTMKALTTKKEVGEDTLEHTLNFQRYAYQVITDSVSFAVRKKRNVPYAIADDFCSYLQSLDRGILLVTLQGAMPTEEWAKLFVSHWTGIETADYILPDLKKAIDQVGIPTLRKHMSPEDTQRYESLPETLIVYRGCGNGGDGLSWTLDKEVAELFVRRKRDATKGMMKFRLMVSTQDADLRDRIQSAKPMKVKLVKGEVRRDDCIAFFGRSEAEIFSNKVKILFDETEQK